MPAVRRRSQEARDDRDFVKGVERRGEPRNLECALISSISHPEIERDGPVG